MNTKIKFQRYPSGVNIKSPYVYLRTLQDEKDPGYRKLFNESYAALSKPFEGEEGMFSKSFYRVGLSQLKQAIFNERDKEVSIINILGQKFGVDFLQSLGNPNEDIGKFYNNLQIAFEKIVYQTKDFQERIKSFGGLPELKTSKTGKEYWKDNRLTLQYESRLLSNIKNFMKGKLSSDIMTALKTNGFSDLDQIMFETMVSLLEATLDSTDEKYNTPEKRRQEVLKIAQGDVERVKKILMPIKEASALGNIDKDLKNYNNSLNALFTDYITKRGKTISKLGPTKKQIGSFVKVKGYSAESILAELLKKVKGIIGVMSSGPTGGRVDTTAVVYAGEVTIDIAGAAKSLMQGVIQNDNGSFLRDAYEIAKKWEQKLQETANELKDAKEEMFLLHYSDKDWEPHSISGEFPQLKKGAVQKLGSGFWGGEGMTIPSFANFIRDFGYKNIDFLIFALNNTSPESVGRDNLTQLSNFLAVYIGTFLFEDGISIYTGGLSQKAKQQKLGVVHLFYVNQRVIPLSYLLQNIYTQLEQYVSMQNSASLQGFAKINITPIYSMGNYLQKLPLEGIDRWEHLKNKSLEKTRITVSFMKNFSDVMSKIVNT